MGEGEQLEYDLEKMVTGIDELQPKALKLTEAEWDRFEEVKKEIMAHR